jgi:hypothetical protein
VQTPAWQVSAPSHTFPFGHPVPFATFVCVTPATGSQASVVHGFPSFTTGGVPGVHTPAWQVSAPSHTVAFGHAVPFVTLVWVTPPTGSQASAVQGFPSLTTGGVPGVQTPAWQVSAPSHTVAFGQAVPFAATGFEHTPVDVLHVPAT